MAIIYIKHMCKDYNVIIFTELKMILCVKLYKYILTSLCLDRLVLLQSSNTIEVGSLDYKYLLLVPTRNHILKRWKKP